ncbi:MAG: hypothetical protein BI182_05780 [Acetobacterium sp. MES1]|uniref:hypothetical protein n=1 Tax=Acetobacterium TaxID=33951 RepID=UPI000B9D2BCB|nr:hypothetical protein [Acetobacterium sp. MES1]OXS25239.1 MAG: hypothetical protein BI182_05780 [Acetobacterium sp. MES1]
MKSKKLLLFPLILVSLTVLLFTGCTPAAEKKDDSKTELPNPMVEQASSEAIKDAIGFTFETLPAGITDVKYFTISDDIAQANFTLGGVNYTVRKGDVMIDNIAGVYTEFQSGETKANASGIPVLYQTNPDGMGLATWKTDKYTYSVYCETGFDLAGMEVVVNGVS